MNKLEKPLTTSNKTFFPSDIGYPYINSNEMSDHIWVGTGSTWRRPTGWIV